MKFKVMTGEVYDLESANTNTMFAAFSSRDQAEDVCLKFNEGRALLSIVPWYTKNVNGVRHGKTVAKTRGVEWGWWLVVGHPGPVFLDGHPELGEVCL